MIKANTKKAIQNIDQYVLDSMEETLQDNNIDLTVKNAYQFLKDDFYRVEQYNWSDGRHANIYECFKWYMQGLPFKFNYYYHSAIKTLGDILEETEEEERNKFTEEQAEERLSHLIYREMLKKAC